MTFSAGLFALSLLVTASALPEKQEATGKGTINWRLCPELAKEVTESVGLPVQIPFDCAVLPVPLDYTDSSSELLNLTLIRVPASKKPVLGSVIWNAGGPGGSGVDNLSIQGADLVAVLGGQFNIVSWDPRGTGKTLPFDCKIQPAVKLEARRLPGLTSTNLTEQFLNTGFKDAVTFADACYASMNATGELIGTAFTARDVIRITDALGEGGQVRYWGPSYGSQLGMVLAAMFPERIERMVLDGNTNPHDFIRGNYGNYLIDADKTFLAFLEECAQAKEKCALVSSAGLNTAMDMLNAINKILLDPLAELVYESTAAFDAYVGAKSALFSGLYYPNTWPSLAETIVGLLNGSAAAAAAAAPTETKPKPPPYNLGIDSVNGIRGSDALWTASKPEDILEEVKKQASYSTSFSDIGFYFTWASAAWKMKAKEQYKGDFKVKTNYPILFINGAWDVSTPLANALNATTGFQDSVVLQHNGYGHTLIADPSLCTLRYFQDYFKHGTLPAPGTHCEPESKPWNRPEKAKVASRSVDDVKLLDAVTNLGLLKARSGLL
ncbi:hypothetical protein ACLOAV_008286 [Pseudogymnoascus australis]